MRREKGEEGGGGRGGRTLFLALAPEHSQLLSRLLTPGFWNGMEWNESLTLPLPPALFRSFSGSLRPPAVAESLVLLALLSLHNREAVEFDLSTSHSNPRNPSFFKSVTGCYLVVLLIYALYT